MLLEASLQFPTVVFSIALGVMVVYWAFVLLGALDIDLFHGDAGDAVVGAAKGGPEALKGLQADSHVEGGFWNALGLGSVPITITISFVALAGWIGSLLAMQYAVPALAGPDWLAALVLPVALVVALLVASLAVRPLAPLFAFAEGKSNKDYVGHVCTINTGSVDERFGQATIEDGGSVLVIPVRCDASGKLGRGDKALIIDFDLERQAYVVEPSADMLGAAQEDAVSVERT